jgi:uncharacterized protein
MRAKRFYDSNPLVYVDSSAIHGHGLFAAVAIGKGTHIGSYDGPPARRDGTHVLWVYEEDEDKWVGRDGRNVLRYCNHSSQPNAAFDGFELYAIRGIRPGEEITFHYGEDWEDIE